MTSPATARVPADIAAVDAGWLTEVLRGDDSTADDVIVTDLRAEQIAQDSGFSSLLYERRGHDEELVREYLDRLDENGVTDYAFDEAWRHYRFAVAYLMVLPVITLVGWDTMPERSRALCITLVDRAVATIDASEVFEA